MNRRHLFLSIIPNLILLTLWVIAVHAREAGNFNFSSEKCVTGQADPWKPETLGIKDVQWLHDRTLQVTAFVSENCIARISEGDYSITDNTIILKYVSTRPKGRYAYCVCAHKLQYIFEDLDKKEYQFKLESREEEVN